MVAFWARSWKAFILIMSSVLSFVDSATALTPKHCRGVIEGDPWNLHYSLTRGAEKSDDSELRHYTAHALWLRHAAFDVYFGHQRNTSGDGEPIYISRANITPKTNLFFVGDPFPGLETESDLVGKNVSVSIRSLDNNRFVEVVGQFRYNEEKKAYHFNKLETFESSERLHIGQYLRSGMDLGLFVAIHDGENWIPKFSTALPSFVAMIGRADSELARISRDHLCSMGGIFGLR